MTVARDGDPVSVPSTGVVEALIGDSADSGARDGDGDATGRGSAPIGRSGAVAAIDTVSGAGAGIAHRTGAAGRATRADGGIGPLISPSPRPP